MHPTHPAVLVTSIGNKVPLLKAVADALQRLRLPWPLHGCDSDPNVPGLYYVDHFWLARSYHDLIDYCTQHHILVLIPTRDGELAYFSREAEHFAQQGITVMVSEPEAIDICLDKLRFYHWLKDRNYPVIPTAEALEDISEEKVVVKERYGAGSRAIGLDLTHQEAQQHALQLNSPLFQPLIRGREWTVDLYRSMRNPKQVQGLVARLRDRVVHGESVITTTCRKPALEALCSKMADEMDVKGHVHFQVLERVEDEFFVIECNPRFGGASTASLAAGLDSFGWLFREVQGEVLEPTAFHRIEGEIRQVRSPCDLIIPFG